MRPALLNSRWIAATVCVVVFSRAMADDGVIRLNDKNTDDSDTGVIRLSHSDPTPPRASLAPPDARAYYESNSYSPDAHFSAYARLYGMETDEPSEIQPIGYTASLTPDYGVIGIADAGYGIPLDVYSGSYAPYDCNSGDCYGGWGMESGGAGYSGDCYSGTCNDGNSCDNGKAKRMPNRKFKKMLKSRNDRCYRSGFQNRLSLLARATPKRIGAGNWPTRFWRGQQMNYLARNQHLSNALFGWLVPSGCGGQGCPPVGKYQVTYADDPGYTHDQDQMRYGAQGYGTHVQVPLAPTVRYSYNYSWGTPSSRLTQVGSYDPQTSAQPLYRQCF